MMCSKVVRVVVIIVYSKFLDLQAPQNQSIFSKIDVKRLLINLHEQKSVIWEDFHFFNWVYKCFMVLSIFSPSSLSWNLISSLSLMFMLFPIKGKSSLMGTHFVLLSCGAAWQSSLSWKSSLLGSHRYLTDNKVKSELIYSISMKRTDPIDLGQNVWKKKPLRMPQNIVRHLYHT